MKIFNVSALDVAKICCLMWITVAIASFAMDAQHGIYYYEVTQGTTDSSIPFVQGGNNIDHHGFRFFRVPSHYSFDDPVVFPGHEGAAHLHMFYENSEVDYTSNSNSVINM